MYEQQAAIGSSCSGRVHFFALPELDTTAEDIYLRGIYGQQRLQASIMWNGQLRIIFDSFNVTFTPVWANPLWQGLGWPYDKEREQILSSLRETSMALPSRHISWDLTQEELHNGLLWPRLTGRLQCGLRLLALQTSAWTMIFGFDTLRGCGFWLCVTTLSWKCRSVFKSAIRTLFRIILSRGNQLFPSITPLRVQDWLLIELTTGSLRGSGFELNSDSLTHILSHRLIRRNLAVSCWLFCYIKWPCRINL